MKSLRQTVAWKIFTFACGALITIIGVSCTRAIEVREGFFLPSSGFEELERKNNDNMGGKLRFDGCYWRRIRHPNNDSMPTSTVVYMRFWKSGAMLQGVVPRGGAPIIGDAPLPGAADVDSLDSAVAGRYVFDINSMSIDVKIYTCPPIGWRFMKNKYRLIDKSLVLVSSDAGDGWGSQPVGAEWKFLPLVGLELAPFW